MTRRSRRTSGFLLFECMLAVLIFGLGILALSRCVENCIRTEKFRREEALARQLLANRMTEIISGAIPLGEKSGEKFEKGPWAGMSLVTTREQLQLFNEKEQELFGLYKVQLALSWQSAGETVSRELWFYHYPRQR